MVRVGLQQVGGWVVAGCDRFVSDQLLDNALIYIPQSLSAEELSLFWGHCVKGQGYRGQICQTCFRLFK